MTVVVVVEAEYINITTRMRHGSHRGSHHIVGGLTDHNERWRLF